MIVHGGVNFEPYRKKLLESIGTPITTIETFPASEGFFAFQDSQDSEGLLLNTDSGIYFEFVRASEIFNDAPERLSLKDVKVGENYALVLNSNAGLWGYNLGDTIRFVSTDPYRIQVTGRIKHFISAFGEHVIGEEVEHSLMKAAEAENVRITEFTVAPVVGQDRSYHEWFVEFGNPPADLRNFAQQVDRNLRQKNIYYNDLITGNILSPLNIRPVRKNGFIDFMKSIGKLGGQNKVPRLSNDRRVAELLEKFVE